MRAFRNYLMKTGNDFRRKTGLITFLNDGPGFYHRYWIRLPAPAQQRNAPETLASDQSSQVREAHG